MAKKGPPTMQQAYAELHTNQKYFPGFSIQEHVPRIAELVAKHQAKTLLDYGSGKGYQYLGRRVHEQWGGILPRCYDFGVPHLAEKPAGRFDGVICTDMLEHVEAHDIEQIINEICGYALRFAFFAIHTGPDRGKKFKLLPDGRSLHVTIQPPEWWEQWFAPHRDYIEVVSVYDGAE